MRAGTTRVSRRASGAASTATTAGTWTAARGAAGDEGARQNLRKNRAAAAQDQASRSAWRGGATQSVRARENGCARRSGRAAKQVVDATGPGEQNMRAMPVRGTGDHRGTADGATVIARGGCDGENRICG